MSLLHAPLAAALLCTTPATSEVELPTAVFAAPAPAVQQPQASDDIPLPSCGDADEVVLPSGMKYCQLVEAPGKDYPVEGDRVKVHYAGWNLDGSMFDTSLNPRSPGMPVEPFTFVIGGGVIDGWSEITQLMTPGDKWRVTIPSALAYGEGGSPPVIQPNADLIFMIEMLEIVDRRVEFVEWPTPAEGEAPADDVTAFESGMQVRVLADGTGPALSDADLGMFRFGCFNPAGGYVFGHTSQGEQLRLSPNQQVPLPFLKDLMPMMKSGAKLHCNLPSSAGIGSGPGEIPNLPQGSNEVWIFECTNVMSFEKPEFVMPAEEDLTTTASGLKYKIVRPGNGKQPTAANSVVAHYAGWLTTGSPFDNSYDRGSPSTFPLRGVVAGWTEGLQLLKEGGAAWFVLPPELGYKDQNKPGIPPNSTLVFYVELVGVQ